MEIVIITGMSGAGKSLAADILEDFGFFCIDNLPASLLGELVKAYTKTKAEKGEEMNGSRLALVMDMRSFNLFGDLLPALDKLEADEINYKLIFLEAETNVLVSRYKQTRRNHPLAKKISLPAAIAQERKLLEPVKAVATHTIDTSSIKSHILRDQLYSIINAKDHEQSMSILIQSFGFKYSAPSDCDLIFDVRFIPNPFYLDELRPLSGLDSEIKDYVFSFEQSSQFMQRTSSYLEFLLPYYQKEGKARLVIGIGCTGGRHRSVCLAEELKINLAKLSYQTLLIHRDLNNEG